MTELKTNIQHALSAFNVIDIYTAATNFWQTLGYKSDRIPAEKSYESIGQFSQAFDDRHKINHVKVKADDWISVNILFQLTDSEIKEMSFLEFQDDIFGNFGRMVNNTIINSYLFVALELSGTEYTRTELATITREINRCFAMPVLILFKYNKHLTLSAINRRINKNDANQDVLEKVTLIKDIDYLNPHRAHIETLTLLSFKQLNNKVRIDSFVKLHNTWQKVLDVKEINDRFFREIRNWFLWSIKHIRFPQIRPPEEMEEDKEYQSKSIIRFITRFMFCWFLKEKRDIIPSDFFNHEKLSALLKNFDTKSSSSDYYHAILQNLFFATLSVPQTERRIIDQSEYPNTNPDYGKPYVFRYHECYENEEVIRTLFQAIPFLNGGLFDCLDRRKDHNQDIEIRLDGFSTKQSKQAVFPNYLFWGTHSVDLSEELNTAKAKDTKVLGLIDLFDQYVFTVEESTPIEEEIALDPELLGRVFENILAFINPETHETARKGTGSFYTPRRVVDYMVDAALKEHLSQELKNYMKMSDADIETGLGILFEYSEKEHAFNTREAQCIVQAIDNCKVVDPACGSGAFLMGTLHRMTNLLSKIDKDNSIWFEKLIERFPAHLQEQMLNKLRHESLTYTRKLGLIQNCIYGVDIQPIAVQIAKLRFFLTLIIEQDIDLNKENYGIIPLPNLEFKLVCADTIATLSDDVTKEDKDYDEFLENPYTTSLAKEVHKYFAVNLPGDKLKTKSNILKIIRAYVQPHLKNISSLQSSMQLYSDKQKKRMESQLQLLKFKTSQWLSYSGIFDDKSILFFETQLFFPEIRDGFDIVIGNPPYIQLQSKLLQEKATLYSAMDYTVFDKTGDIYCLFYERGLQLLKEKGHLCYITSNKWMRAAYGLSLRNLFISHNPRLLINIGPSVFDHATVDTNIILLSKDNNRSCLLTADLSTQNYPVEDFTAVIESNLQPQVMQPDSIWFLGDGSIQNIHRKIEQLGKPLKEWPIIINRGIVTGLNDAFVISEDMKNQLCSIKPNSIEIIKPLLRGRDIQKYLSKWENQYIISTFPALNVDIESYIAVKEYLLSYGKDKLQQVGKKLQDGSMSRKKTGNKWFETQDQISYFADFDKDKLIWKRIGSVLRFAYDDQQYYALDSTCIMTGENLLEICAILNSRLGNWILLQTAPKTGTGDIITSVQAIEPFRIPDITNDNAEIFEVLKNLAMRIINAKKAGRCDTTSLESEVDNLVYKLYGLSPEEIKNVEMMLD